MIKKTSSFSRAMLLIATSFTLAACSVSSNEKFESLEASNSYKPNNLNTKDIPTGETVVVFYREEQVSGPAINVYVDGDYQASLLQNGFSPAILCADQHLFSTSISSSTKAGNRTDGITLASPSQQATYIKVTTAKSGEPHFEIVKPEVAATELAALRIQKQTLSRVTVNCQSNEYVLEATSVNSDIAFPFNQYKYNQIQPKGKQSIEDFANKIKALNQKEISKIVVNGYADPKGAATYNQILSEKRAQAVSSALKGYGITTPMTVVGYGEKELMVKDCGVEHHSNKSAETQCNLPNRRVDILVYGRDR